MPTNLVSRGPWLKVLLVVQLCLCISSLALPQQQRIYIAPDDHTDYMWTANEEGYRQAITQMMDYYLILTDKTAAAPPNFQSRWNLDGSMWMWIWEQNRDQKQVDRLVQRLKDGHFSMPLTFAVSTYGGMPSEAVLRSMYYSGEIERRYSLQLPMAIAMEDQTLPRGLGALFAGAGARYSWRGVCACATRMEPTIHERRPHEIYWWQGPDGSRVLLKWYSLYPVPKNDGAYSPGGYAEVRDIPGSIHATADNPKFREAYPYSIVGLFGEGGDNLSTINDDYPMAAKGLSTPDREVIVSNEEDFFRDFEKQYGATLPVYRAALGNEWDLYSASMSEVTAKVRRATEKLRSAEAIETMVAMEQPYFLKQFDAARKQAWTSYGLFWEHDWTADSKVIPRADRASWQRRMADSITSYVEGLLTASVETLGTLIAKKGDQPRYFVFNPLSWTRSDTADLPFAGSGDVHVVDLTTGNEVPSQFADVSVDDGSSRRVLRIWASDVPPVGYKVFEVRQGKGREFGESPTANGNTLENSEFRVRVNERGAIVSIIAKKFGNRELAASIDGRNVNDLGEGMGTLSVRNAGPVSVTLEANVRGSLPHKTQVTLFRDSGRIAIRNEITANFADVKQWAFSFKLSAPDVWHEEVGAINHARIEPEGDYAAKFSRLDWLTLNHFVSMIGADGVGITLSNSDDAFMKLGHSSISNGISQLDTATPQISVLAGGQVDGPELGIPNQGGDTYFLQRFAIGVYRQFDAADSMRFALEDQNPFTVGAVTGGYAYPESEFSLLSIPNPGVILWALKPAEDGIEKGLIARVWNLTPKGDGFALNLKNGISQTLNVTHLETAVDPDVLPPNQPGTELSPWQMRTFLLRPRTQQPASGTKGE